MCDAVVNSVTSIEERCDPALECRSGLQVSIIGDIDQPDIDQRYRRRVPNSNVQITGTYLQVIY